MKTAILSTRFLGAALLALCGCGGDDGTPQPRKPATETGGHTSRPIAPAPSPVRAGSARSVAFALGWRTSADPALASRAAAADALGALGCAAKALVFYEYFPKAVEDVRGRPGEAPDLDKERKILPALRPVAKAVPLIGCRARALVNGGTRMANTVAVLAIGGDQVACQAAKAPLEDDRKAVGVALARQLESLGELKLVLILSEMRPLLDGGDGRRGADFIAGVQQTAPKGVVLFGGNGMPNDPPATQSSVQFFGDDILSGHVVALGIAGPIAVHPNHTSEFVPSDQAVMVTKSEGNWVYELDGKPATDEFRRLAAMAPDEPITADSRHAIGLVVARTVYVRMVLEADAQHKALRFVAPVPVSQKVRILRGGTGPKAVLDSARQGIVQSLYKAGDAEPLLALVAASAARGRRLRGGPCAVLHAILPALGDHRAVPVFGFYAWGALGPLAGPLDGLSCAYHRHTFLCAIVTQAR